VTDRCPDCGRPIGPGRHECGAQLMGAIDEDHDDCLNAQMARLRASLAAALKTVEAADRIVTVTDRPAHSFWAWYRSCRAELARVMGTDAGGEKR
jgi:hypothetical protein